MRSDTGISSDTDKGTYTIDGDKILMVKDNGLKFTYIFSEDMQSFHQEFESDKFSFKREKTWAEIFGGKKKNADG
jgi:hydrogenase maturation factor